MDQDQDVSRYPVPERVILMAQLGVDRLSYQALEQAIIEILLDESHLFTQRVLAAFVLVDAATIEYGRGSKSTGAFSVWLDHMLSPEKSEWIYQEAAGKARRMVNRGSQRRVLASIICPWEARLALDAGGRSPGGLGCALAIARGSGSVYLPSLGTEVKLDAMGKVEMDQDLVRLAPILTGYLVDCVRRGQLIRHSSILRGMRFLLARLALVRWYASAVAALRGTERVGEAELREAVSLVTRSYGLESGGTGPGSEDARYGFIPRTLVDMSQPENLALPLPARR